MATNHNKEGSSIIDFAISNNPKRFIQNMYVDGCKRFDAHKPIIIVIRKEGAKIAPSKHKMTLRAQNTSNNIINKSASEWAGKANNHLEHLHKITFKQNLDK